MKSQDCSKISLVFIGFAAAIVLAGGRTANADFIFGKAQNVGPPGGFGLGVSVTADQLELYSSSNRAGGLGARDLWVTTRASIDEEWGPPVNLGAPVDSQYNEVYPSVSADGLTLYFSDYLAGMGAGDRPGGVGGHDIWMSTRSSRSDPWTAPVNMGAPINTSTEDMSPTISHDGLTLIFASNPSSAVG